MNFELHSEAILAEFSKNATIEDIADYFDKNDNEIYVRSLNRGDIASGNKSRKKSRKKDPVNDSSTLF